MVLLVIEQYLELVCPIYAHRNLVSDQIVCLLSNRNLFLEILGRDIDGHVSEKTDKVLVVETELQTRTVWDTPQTQDDSLDLEIFVFG